MKNEKLQPSEALEKFFAPRREEAPLLSTPEIEKLLDERAMLPNNHPPTPSFFRRGGKLNIRRIIMTLSGITGLAAIAYLTFFSNHSHGTDRADQPHPSHLATANNPLSPPAISAAVPEKHSPQPVAKAAPRGPWSAGNDQIYADLSREELARLGIVVKDDTILTYKLDSKDRIVGMPLTAHFISSGDIVTSLPTGVQPHRFYPMLMTFSNGHGAAYHTEQDGQIEMEILVKEQEGFRDWLQKPPTPGYSALGILSIIRENINGTIHDSVTLVIGKDLPQPMPIPFQAPNIEGYSDSVNQALTALAHFYEGKGSRPEFSLPSTLKIKVDTATAQDLQHRLDEEENTATMKKMNSIMARLNELVPVIVRTKGSSGAPDSNDFIFWYEPSEELFAALPPAQAEAFRKKLAEPPQCMNAPEAVTTEAQVTYCVSEVQQVNVRVFDLMGHIVKSETQHAEAGDNIAKINTETLPSGMYIILVQDNDGGERTRRIWVQNANPK